MTVIIQILLRLRKTWPWLWSKTNSYAFKCAWENMEALPKANMSVRKKVVRLYRMTIPLWGH